MYRLVQLTICGGTTAVKKTITTWKPSEDGDTIGVNHLSANPTSRDKTLWYSGFELAASVLLTVRVPRILQAFTIEGKGALPSNRE
jgi:hypothetical protein